MVHGAMRCLVLVSEEITDIQVWPVDFACWVATLFIIHRILRTSL